MHQFKFVSVLLMAMILVGCGGGGSDVPAKPRFAAQVSFGDSLSDVGSYRVVTIASVAGEGQFTINPASSVQANTPTNWTEYTSLSLGLGMPCAAVTGGFGVAASSHAGCFGYGEGGSRVTDPAGVGNAGLTGNVFNAAMTVPVVTQIANYLSTAVGKKFAGDEIVTLMAGANDVFYQAGLVAASAVTPTSAVVAVQTAATQLAAAVNTQIIANGAKYVVVANIPDIGVSPYGVSLGSNVLLINKLVTAFNAQLKASLPDSANVLNVDAYTASKDEVANPLKYNLSNAAIPACNIAVLPNNSSLFCNSGTLSYTDPHFLFADAVHPTPYGHLLFATYVLQAMTNKGWY